MSDLALYLVAGPEAVDQLARLEPLVSFLGSEVLRGLQVLASDLRERVTYEEFELLPEERATHWLESLAPSLAENQIEEHFSSLLPEQRAVMMMLFAIHDGPVLFPMALVTDNCTDGEYALGVMASKAFLTTAFGDISDSAHRKSFEGMRSDAHICREYLSLYREGTPTGILLQALMLGEGHNQEFKSSSRRNLHTNTNDFRITEACLKSIAAFMNTEGGRLLIGVRDDGSIIGTECDGFSNTDKWLLHFTSVVKQNLHCVSEDVLTRMLVDTRNVDDKTVCLITCLRSSTPVYLNSEKDGEDAFYIRTGPGSTRLATSKAVNYIREHFQDGTG